jgi:hypothetical protein
MCVNEMSINNINVKNLQEKVTQLFFVPHDKGDPRIYVYI